MFILKNIQRILVCVEYNGSNYYGWQKQPNRITVQSVIEKCLSKIANHTIYIYCASRTDSGVHGVNQIFHFDTFACRKKNEWLYGSNAILPKDISFKYIKYIDNNFHARFSAIARRYIYILCNSKIRCSLLHKQVAYYPYNIDFPLIIKASKLFCGQHNFRFFTSSKNKTFSYIRNIFYFNIYKKNSYIFFDIKGNSFLYHMIRNIISVLLLVARGKYSLHYITDVLLLKTKLNVNLIDASGLYLYSVFYK